MQPWNIAHRGGAQARPENTLAAFAHAEACGYDGAELDVQLSRDGEVVVFHDYRLKPEICRDENGRRLALPTPRLKDLSLAELRRFDIGRADPASAYAREHADVVWQDGERIPTLGEVVAVAKAASAPFHLFVELKTSFSDREISAQPEELAERTVAVLKACDYLERTVFVGFDWPGLLHVKKIAPAAQCWFSTMTFAGLPVLDEIKAKGGDGWFPAWTDATDEAVRGARGFGLKVGAWTVNDPAQMHMLITRGLDAICTDRPDLLAAL
ncbi:MAG: glycerophosphodiester phosphodiesterase family protein [Rhizomicrobium sp.]